MKDKFTKLAVGFGNLIKKRIIQVVTLAILKFQIKTEGHDMGWMLTYIIGPIFNSVTGLKTRPLDRRYWTCSEEDFNKIIKADWIDEKKHLENRFDCDDFAIQLKARLSAIFGLNNVALVINKSHVFNLIFFSDSTYKFFEPQNDAWVIKMTGKYTLTNALIIF
jgi:hypothetical protein